MFERLFAPLLKAPAFRRRLHSVIGRVNYRRRIRVAGTRVVIPSIRGLTCELSETWMEELLLRLLPLQAGAFVDVGVNVGQTLLKVKAIDARRCYVGFEPNPVCVFYARELIWANEFADCTLVPVGLHTEDRVLMLDLYSAEAVDSGASLVPRFRPDRRVHASVPVPVFRFDSVAPLLPVGLGIVKIDVEGAELEVMQSLLHALERDRPVVLVEVLPAYVAENTARLDRQHALERLIGALDYAMFRVLKTEAGGLAGVQRIDAIGVHGDLDQCDYVLVHRDAAARIEAGLRRQ